MILLRLFDEMNRLAKEQNSAFDWQSDLVKELYPDEKGR